MANVTGTIGNESVELNNASTEATLLAVLQTLQRQTSLFQTNNRLLTQMGRGGAGGAQAGGPAAAAATAASNQQAQAQGAAATATNVASKSMGGLSKGALIVGGVLGDLAAGAMKTVGNLTDFAGKLLDGTATVSGLFGAFKDLPLGIGLVAGLFEKLAGMQEENLNAFRELSKSGINLGGDLNQVRLQALEAGLTMSEYGEVLSKNAATIALMGNSVDDGARSFRAVSKALTTGGLSTQLLGLGYSFKDINDLAANYIKVNGGLTEAQKKDSNKLAQSVANYGKELDVLSRITGKNREQLEKEQESMTQDANFQNYLNGLDADERDKANAALRLAMESGGKGAADALKAKLLGLPPLTEEAQLYMATMQKGGKSIEDFYNIVKNGKTLQESQLELDKAFGSAVAGNIKDLKQFETVMRAGGMTGDKMATTLMSVQETINKYKQKGLTDEQAIQEAIQEERKKQIVQSQSAAAAAAESEKALKSMGAELMGALMPVFQMLSPIINNLAQQFMGFARDNMPAIKEALEVFVKYVSNFVKNMFSEDGRAKIVNDLTYYLKLMMIEVKKALLPKLMYSEADAENDRKKLELEKQSYDKKAEASQVEMDNSKKLEALKVVKDEKERAKIEGEKAKAEADIKKLEDLKNSGTKLDGEQQKQLELAKSTLKKKQEILDLSKDEGAMKAAETAKGNATTLRTQGENAMNAAKDVGTSQQADLIDYSVTGGLGAAKGGIFKGPETGYMVQLHGHEAVVPMENTAIKSPLDDGPFKGFDPTDAKKPEVKPKEPIVSKSNLETMPPMGGMLANQLSAGQNIFKDVFSGFTSKLPSLNDIGGSVGSVPPLDKSMLDELNKSFTSFGKTITDRVGISTDSSTAPGSKPEAQQALTIAAITTNGELQTLNNNIKEMLRIVKASYDLERSHLDATRGLQGNLYQ